MIFFDNIIFALQKAGGISVVWSELLKRIVNSDMDYKCLEYNDYRNNIFRKSLDIPKSHVVEKNYPFLPVQRYFNPRISFDGAPFIFHSSYYRHCTCKNAVNITTVHDFTYEYFVKGLKKNVHCKQKYDAIRNSDYIICISETTKKDLLKHIKGVDEKKISVIYNGVSDYYYPIQNCTNDNIYSEFAMFIGQRGGYKNFTLAVSAIKNTNLNLVIVGSPLSKEEKCLLETELGVNRFFFLGRISNEKLNLLYNQAYCLLYLSAYEGFGIPVIEAQKSGCPVIVLNTPSIVEIVGDTTLVAENDTNSVLEKIYLLGNENIRKNVVNLGANNATQYSWDIMAEQIFSLYKFVLNKQ